MHATTIVRNLRLTSGLVLMAFVFSHVGNLMIGMHSLAAMEAWRGTLMGPWQSAIGQVLLIGAAGVHITLGLYAIAARRSLAMSRTDVVQLTLGLLTPPLLLTHVIATHFANADLPGFESSYGLMLAVYWSYAPIYAFQQLFVVVIVWVHGALGLYSWLVLKPVWRRIGGVVLPVLFVVPILALVGFAEAGKEVLARLASDAAWQAQIKADADLVAKFSEDLASFQTRVFLIYGLLVLLAACVLASRMFRNWRKPVSIAYDQGLSAQGRRGLSILELSRANDIPHAHVCSGRGRCGTCRVHVDAGAQSLSPLNDIERATLAHVHAGEGVRLACQARVLASGVVVTRLLPSYADVADARAPLEWAAASSAGDPATAP